MDRIRIVSALKYVNVEKRLDNVGFPIISILPKGDPLIAMFNHKNFNDYYGNKGVIEIVNNACVFIDQPRDEFQNFFENESLSGLAADVNLFLHAYLASISIIKDNSIRLGTCMVILNEHEDGKSNERLDFNTLASGGYSNVDLSHNDIKIANEYFQAIHGKMVTPIKMTDIEPNQETIINPNHQEPYAPLRLVRAITLSSYARSQGFLPYKISFFINVLECIYSIGDNTEVSHKVAVRAASALGINKAEKVSIMKEVKDAYGLRSKFFHGQPFVGKKEPISIEFLQETSIKIDFIVRKSIQHVINNIEVFHANENTLSEYFSELLFS